MRIREKKYKDYGIDTTEKEKILDFCKNANAYERKLIFQAAVCSNPDIAEYLCESLTKGISYDMIFKKKYVPIGRDDFYGYRRKTISIIRNFLILNIKC